MVMPGQIHSLPIGRLPRAFAFCAAKDPAGFAFGRRTRGFVERIFSRYRRLVSFFGAPLYFLRRQSRSGSLAAPRLLRLGLYANPLSLVWLVKIDRILKNAITVVLNTNLHVGRSADANRRRPPNSPRLSNLLLSTHEEAELGTGREGLRFYELAHAFRRAPEGSILPLHSDADGRSHSEAYGPALAPASGRPGIVPSAGAFSPVCERFLLCAPRLDVPEASARSVSFTPVLASSMGGLRVIPSVRRSPLNCAPLAASGLDLRVAATRADTALPTAEVGSASHSSRVIAFMASSSLRSEPPSLGAVHSRMADPMTGSVSSVPERQDAAGATVLPRRGHAQAHGRLTLKSAKAPPAHNLAEGGLGRPIATSFLQKQPRPEAVGALGHTGRNAQKVYSIAARSICFSRRTSVGPTRSWTGSQKGPWSGAAPVTHVQGLGKGSTGTSGNVFIPGPETRRVPERNMGRAPDGIPLHHGRFFSNDEAAKVNARREHGSLGGSRIRQELPLLTHATPAPAIGRLVRDAATDSATTGRAMDGKMQPPSMRAPCASASAPERGSSRALSEDDVSYLANRVYGLITDSVRREKELNGY